MVERKTSQLILNLNKKTIFVLFKHHFMKNLKIISTVFLSLIFWGFDCLEQKNDTAKQTVSAFISQFSDPKNPDCKAIAFHFSPITGIGKEKNICRRDPSDIIKIGEYYVVFYTKLKRDAPVYPEGFYGTVWYAVSSDEGYHWVEKGKIVEKGNKGKFDSFGTYTPNVILGKDKKVYIYYTGVADGFDNLLDDYTTKNRTAIGVIEAQFDKKGNLISKKKLNNGNPILIPSPEDSNEFDSFRIDDTSMLFKDDRYWLYYKGRGYLLRPSKTKMGVAISSTPYGPFVKQNNGKAIQKEGHEVLVWPYKDGVLSLVTNVGQGLYYASDGISMKKIIYKLKDKLKAPGLYRPDLTQEGSLNNGKKKWGIAMATYANDPFLHRYEMILPDCLEKIIDKKE